MNYSSRSSANKGDREEEVDIKTDTEESSAIEVAEMTKLTMKMILHNAIFIGYKCIIGLLLFLYLFSETRRQTCAVRTIR